MRLEGGPTKNPLRSDADERIWLLWPCIRDFEWVKDPARQGLHPNPNDLSVREGGRKEEKEKRKKNTKKRKRTASPACHWAKRLDHEEIRGSAEDENYDGRWSQKI